MSINCPLFLFLSPSHVQDFFSNLSKERGDFRVFASLTKKASKIGFYFWDRNDQGWITYSEDIVAWREGSWFDVEYTINNIHQPDFEGYANEERLWELLNGCVPQAIEIERGI